MNSQDADRQILQMIEFIKQEAREKAEEIEVKTEAEFTSRKLNAVAQARTELKEEYSKKRKEQRSKKRIIRSRMINEARFDEMRERDRILKQLKADVAARLADVSKHPKYPELIRALICQGLLTIMEKNVELKCREVDLPVVQEQLPLAYEAFKQIVVKESGADPQLNVTLNKQAFLAPPPKPGSDAVSCAGGVMLSARSGKIICRNTLDHRAELAFHNLLPAIREAVFGARAAAVAKKKAASAPHH